MACRARDSPMTRGRDTAPCSAAVTRRIRSAPAQAAATACSTGAAPAIMAAIYDRKPPGNAKAIPTSAASTEAIPFSRSIDELPRGCRQPSGQTGTTSIFEPGDDSHQVITENGRALAPSIGQAPHPLQIPE
jgi:hypothetical protein